MVTQKEILLTSLFHKVILIMHHEFQTNRGADRCEPAFKQFRQ